ncbi:MAG: [FeFe] hydrogenase H-cluster radical SAM maturase HydE [Endomicrobium sp.]|jgi:biotin synthase|nr:[FeFe] hydrogenase H-cluster radical SAM maturase HydE [Endomicrobium sp.]
MNTDIDLILNKAALEHFLTEKEILRLLELKDFSALTCAADSVRQKYLGDEVHLRALIEFSNYCGQNCVYCGLRRDNRVLERYRIEPDEIIELAKKAKSYGYKTIVLQSGEDRYYSVEKLVKIISEIKKSDMALTLRIGEKTYEEYKAFRDAGADRYLLRIETTDEELYAKYDPGMSLSNRKQCLENIKKLGYETGSGIIVGLPGQTLQSIAKDILYLKSIPVDMAGIGPFIYNPDTPVYCGKTQNLEFKTRLKEFEKNNFETSLKVMAVLRLLMPDINIPATTAMETLNPQGRIIALQSGANVVMPNATEGERRKQYAIYPGKICISDTPAKCSFCITNKIKSIGRTVSQHQGFHKKAINKEYI